MPKLIGCAVVLVGCLSGSGLAAAEFSPLDQEQIGALRYGLPETAFKKAIKCTPKRGAETFAAADGAWHQDWEYPQCGLSLGTVSAKKRGVKTIETITVSAPSVLTTKKGIKIGSSEQDVRHAYQAHWNKDLSESVDGFAGGSQSGMLVFRFDKGKVSSIFLGVGAE